MTHSVLAAEVDALLYTDGPASREERECKKRLAEALREKSRRDALASIMETLSNLYDDEDRVEVMSQITDAFCQHCWRATPPHDHCQCWNDE